MMRASCHGLLFLSLLLTSSAFEVINPRYIDGYFSVEGILQCQKVSDFLIAAAYFSIPLELLYFATCSDLFPFKWIVFLFGAFIVLCGLTHFLNVFTYEPHSFHLMLGLTVSKLFTALVSFATAITLLTLIPQLLRVKVRENFLRLKAHELHREVGMMKRQEEAGWHVRMLTQEIRKSLDRHTILYTTLVELSKTLGLQNCAIWMPDKGKNVMNLTHELNQRRSTKFYEHSIPVFDQDVLEVNESKNVKILRRDSLLALASSGRGPELGSIAAIRMPMLEVSNFKGGTPELIQASYAILVLVLPENDSRIWSCREKEIIEVVADQVAVALSHAAVLEESQLMRDKLAEQNRALLKEKQNAFLTSEARESFQRVMGQGMRRPVHSIVALLSLMQQEKMNPEQRLVVNTIAKTSNVVSNLVTDAMERTSINSEPLSSSASASLSLRRYKGSTDMANGCALQKSTFFSAGERPVICPRPRRLYPSSAVRPFRCNAVYPAEVSDLHPVNDLLDFLLPKQTDTTPPFFCGSPPSRSDNPVVHDARFGQAVLTVPIPPAPATAGSGSGSASASSRSGCTRVRYDFAPATVRVEGFDCLDRVTCQSRGVPAFA